MRLVETGWHARESGSSGGGQLSHSDASVQAQAGGLAEDRHLSGELSHRHAVVGFNDHFASNRLLLHASKRLGTVADRECRRKWDVTLAIGECVEALDDHEVEYTKRHR